MNEIRRWLESIGWAGELEVASADASFRKYYRLRKAEQNYIVMDASLEKESLTPYIDVTNRLLAVGVNAPKILAQDIDKGYLLITDFGSTHYLDKLNESTVDVLYKKAIDEIVVMQQADPSGLPLYDRDFLHFEMNLMQEWYLEKYLVHELSSEDKTVITQTLDHISSVVLEQPQNLFVHRDYHSRNIMLPTPDTLGVIDFQDAMSGALTYDLVSLLKDCYIAFDQEKIEKLALYFRDQKGIKVDDVTFLKWFDYMGLQRHIKVLGVFSRLHIRDGKDGYLKDIPLTLHYTLQTANRYKETQPFAQMLQRLTTQ
jgi:aminoglycoside/choline kinase family phosphotransferase